MTAPLLLPLLLAATLGAGPAGRPGTTGPIPAIPAPPQARPEVPGPNDAWLAEDKLQHFAMSFAAATMSYGAARLGLDHGDAVPVAAGFALALGVGKEVDDARSGRRFSLRDLAWDAAGVALGTVLIRRIR